MTIKYRRAFIIGNDRDGSWVIIIVQCGTGEIDMAQNTTESHFEILLGKGGFGRPGG